MNTIIFLAGVIAAISVNIFSSVLYDAFFSKVFGPATTSKKRIVQISLSVLFVMLAILPFILENLLTTTPAQELIIVDIQANPSIVTAGGISRFSVTAKGEALIYQWKAEKGIIPSGPLAQSTVEYQSPNYPTKDKITVIVTDSQGNSTSRGIFISVVQP